MKNPVMNLVLGFAKKKEGMGTIEVVIIIAVLVTLALIFKDFILDLAQGIFSNIEEGAESATQIL